RGRGEDERVNKVITFTGQSLKGPPDSVAFLMLANTAIDESIPGDKRVSAAGRSQGLALRFGSGRVVVLGEAAQFSAQVIGQTGRRMGMNVPGIDNKQLVGHLACMWP